MEIVRSLRIDKKNKKGLVPVRITAYWEGKRAFFSTGITVHPDDWKNNKVKSSDARHLEKNRILSQLEEKIEKCLYAAATSETDISPELLREQVEGKPVVAEKPAKKKTFFDHFDDFLFSKQNEISPGTGSRITHSTMVTYNVTRTKLVEYANKHGEPVLKELSQTFYDSFRNFVLASGCNTNTFGKFVKCLKAFFNWCEASDVPISPKFRRFSVPVKSQPIEALTASELKKLRKLSVESHDFVTYLYERHQGKAEIEKSVAQEMRMCREVLDTFLFACSTGMHVSDALVVKAENLRDGVIYLSRTKTRTACHIPIMNDDLFCAGEIVAKYEGKYKTLLPYHPDQVQNRKLKVIFAVAGIKRVKPVFKLARKTFATLCVYRGIPTRVIMQMTGHKTESSFNAYVGVNVDEIRVYATQYAPHQQKSA